MTSKPKVFCNSKDAAAACNLNEKTFRDKFVRTGVLRPIEIGGRGKQLFKARDIEQLVSNLRQGKPASGAAQ